MVVKKKNALLIYTKIILSAKSKVYAFMIFFYKILFLSFFLNKISTSDHINSYTILNMKIFYEKRDKSYNNMHLFQESLLYELSLKII